MLVSLTIADLGTSGVRQVFRFSYPVPISREEPIGIELEIRLVSDNDDIIFDIFFHDEERGSSADFDSFSLTDRIKIRSIMFANFFPRSVENATGLFLYFLR